MEFGDRSRFSIAFALNENRGGAWLFGHFCYWIDGVMVGDYDVGTSLRDVLFQMKYILGDQGHRLCQQLVDLPDKKIFNLISTALDETSEEIFKYVPENTLPARFDVCIPIDLFDSWKIFLVEGKVEAKLLCRRVNVGELKAAALRPGEFDEIFKLAYVYLSEIYDESSSVIGDF